MTNKKPEDIINLLVKNSLFKDRKGKTRGEIEGIFKTEDGNILAQVKWINGERSLILVNDFDKDSQIKVDLICQGYGKKISNELDIDKHTNCKSWII